jgi:hypothetical protein
MAEKKPPKMVARKASDRRKGDVARAPKKVAESMKYKMVPKIAVTKKSAGRPKKPQ